MTKHMRDTITYDPPILMRLVCHVKTKAAEKLKPGAEVKIVAQYMIAGNYLYATSCGAIFFSHELEPIPALELLAREASG